MAIVTIDDSPLKHLRLEAIPVVDLRLFTQSELNSLSHCSDEAFDLRRCDDIVIPKIDRSVFNESAGSRKQTYNRLRLAPREPEIERRHRRCSGSSFLSVSKTPTQNPNDDPERKENQQIVNLLRELFSKDENNNPCGDRDLTLTLTPTPVLLNQDEELSFSEPVSVESGVVVSGVHGGEKGSRKRGRKSGNGEQGSCRNWKGKEQGNECNAGAIVVYGDGSNDRSAGMEMVNRNGVAVDLKRLAILNDPFGPELRKRTYGMQTEAELLGYLNGVEGRWSSTRKKRKIVDAGDFGDHLPKGWKLLISIKRNRQPVLLNCSRYISPVGQKFVSCKEVSSYLSSIFGVPGTNRANPHYNNESHVNSKLASGSVAGLGYREEKAIDDSVCHQASSLGALPAERENEVTLSRVEILPDIEVRDLLECQNCKMTFDEKDAYVQHLMTSHQSSTKYGLDTSIHDGVTINDGKYECQFCDKFFKERQQYDDHLGVHMKNYDQSLEALTSRTVVPGNTEPSSMSREPVDISNLDESVETEKDSISQSFAKPNGVTIVVDYIPETNNTKSYDKVNIASPCTDQDMEGLHSGPQTPSAGPSDGSPCRKLDGDPVLRTSTIKPSLVLCDASPFCNEDAGLDKMDEAPANESFDRHYNGFEMVENKFREMNNPTESESYCLDSVAVVDYSVEIGTSNVNDDKGFLGSITCGIDECTVEPNDGSRRNLDLMTGTFENKRSGLDAVPLYRNQDSGAEMSETLADDSCDKQYNGYEVAADKFEEINDPNRHLHVKFDSSMGSATFLANNEDIGTSPANDEKFVLGSMISEIDKCTVEQEPGSRSWLTLSCGEQTNGFATTNEVYSVYENKSLFGDDDGFLGMKHSGPDRGTESVMVTDENILETMLTDTSSQLLKSSDHLLTLNTISYKGRNDPSTDRRKPEKVSNFEELKLNITEPSQFSFMSGQGSKSLPQQQPSYYAYANSNLGHGLGTTSINQSDDWVAALPRAVSRPLQVTTLCVWCGSEFTHEAVNLEMQSDDSVGFMCPSCKSKISGQLFGIG